MAEAAAKPTMPDRLRLTRYILQAIALFKQPHTCTGGYRKPLLTECINLGVYGNWDRGLGHFPDIAELLPGSKNGLNLSDRFIS